LWKYRWWMIYIYNLMWIYLYIVVEYVAKWWLRWSCWSLLHLLLSPRIIIHIKLGGLMPCWMYKHSYKVGGLMPCWMLDHSYHVESLCSISWESMLYKSRAWCPDWYHMHSALSSWCCCRCIVVDVELSVLSSCCQVVEIINELLLRNYVKH